MDAVIFGLVTGLISGVIASFVFWFYMTHVVVPKIAFSEKITRLPSSNTKNGLYYQFKFSNPSRRTSAIDVHIRAYIHYPDFPSQGTTNFYRIPTDAIEIMELLPYLPGSRAARRVSLKITSQSFCAKHQSTFFPSEIKRAASSQTVVMEELLSVTEGAFVRVYISASHGFSGSRKVFKKTYRIDDIFQGCFDTKSLHTKEAVVS